MQTTQLIDVNANNTTHWCQCKQHNSLVSMQTTQLIDVNANNPTHDECSLSLFGMYCLQCTVLINSS